MLPGALAILGIVATGCSAAQAPEGAAGPGLAHVHGLGVDPADGMLLAASHYGVYRLPESGEPELVGARQDTMGFTVVGPHHFLGSGHPDPGDTEQGLVRSTDGGRTFTAIGATPRLVLIDWPATELLVAVDAGGSVYRSVDGGTSWVQQGAVRGQPGALATHGESEVYIAAGDGIYASRDSGRTFTLRQSMT